jgi:alanine dehydrogenase
VTLILQAEEINDILTLDEVREAVKRGLLEQAAGHVQLPTRLTIDSASGNGWIRLMPAILNQSKLMGFKAMHSTPGVGVRYVVMLYDLESGELLAVIDADWLTSRRTGATAALGVDALALPSASTVGILGSSEQARAMLSSVALVRRLRRVKVYSPTAEHRERFASEMSQTLNLEVIAVDDARQVFEDSAIVISIYRAGRQPLILSEWIQPGTHLHAASSVRADARELDDEVWRKSDVVAVDDLTDAFESGDGASAIANRALRRDKAIGIWEIIGKAKAGRRRTEDTTLFKAVGTGLQDLAVAAAMYRRASDRGCGTEISDFPRARRSRQ